jgi:pilus assembly protein Flp/PilA
MDLPGAPWLLMFTRRRFPSYSGKAEMKLYIKDFWNDTQGQDLVEYALAAGMVAVAAVAAMPQLSTVVNNVFSKIGSIITSAVA